MSQMAQPRLEFAHYYGDWIWSEELTGWVKNLLLFFDGIALALPAETADALIDSNPVLAQPLMERGILRNYEPSVWLKPESPDVEREQVDRAIDSLGSLASISNSGLLQLLSRK